MTVLLLTLTVILVFLCVFVNHITEGTLVFVHVSMYESLNSLTNTSSTENVLSNKQL